MASANDFSDFCSSQGQPTVNVKAMASRLEKFLFVPSSKVQVGSRPIDRRLSTGQVGYEQGNGRVAVDRNTETAADSPSTTVLDVCKSCDGNQLIPHAFGSSTGHSIFKDYESDDWGSEFDSESEFSNEDSAQSNISTRDASHTNLSFIFNQQLSIDLEESIDDVEDYVWDSAKHPPPQLSECPETLTEIEKKRRPIIKEIFDTENSYVDILQHLINNYCKPLKSHNPPMIPNEHREAIFYKLPKLLEMHRSFQISLEDVARHWDTNPVIGKVFISQFSSSHVRRIYSNYVVNNSSAQELVRSHETSNKLFKSFVEEQQTSSRYRLHLIAVEEQQTSSRYRLHLIALLIYPIQRFPQYITLLHSLIKKTPEDHQDYPLLQQAISKIESLTMFLNAKEEESQQSLKARMILDSLKHQLQNQNIILSHEKLRLIDEIEVSKQSQKSSNVSIVKSKLQTLFLFSTILICCSRQRNKDLKLKWVADLDNVNVEQDENTLDVKKVSPKKFFSLHRRNPEEGNIVQVQDLIHDQEVLRQISTLASSFKYKYSGLEIHNLATISCKLDKLVQQKYDENRILYSSQLLVKIKIENGEKSYVFRFESPKKRNLWIELFAQTKLTQEKCNVNIWHRIDSNIVPQDTFFSCHGIPLLCSVLQLDLSNNLGGIVCATPVCLAYGNILRRYVWCCHVNSGITILSVNNHKSSILQSFRYDDVYGTKFLCVEVVPGRMEASDIFYQADMVWIGTIQNTILLFSLMEEHRTQPFLQIGITSPVVSLCYCNDRVYAGLTNGHICVFLRNEFGSWIILDTICVGTSPVIKIKSLPSREVVVAACDDRLIKIRPIDGNFEVEYIEIECVPNVDRYSRRIRDFVVSEDTAWLCFQSSLIVYLIYLKTHNILQSVHFERILSSVKGRSAENLANEKYDEISCISVVKDCLLIGTLGGYLCEVYVSKMQSSVLQSTSPCAVALYKHIGPVRFIVSYQNLIEKLVTSVSMELEKVTTDNSLFIEEESANQRATNADEEGHRTTLDDSQLNRQRNSICQVSMTSLSNRWLSNPNLLLDTELSSEIMPRFDKLMMICESEDNIETEMTSSTPLSPSRANKDGEGCNQQIFNLETLSRQAMTNRISRASSDYKREKVSMSGTIIVTGGKGCETVEGMDCDYERHISPDEPCVMCWSMK